MLVLSIFIFREWYGDRERDDLFHVQIKRAHFWKSFILFFFSTKAQSFELNIEYDNKTYKIFY